MSNANSASSHLHSNESNSSFIFSFETPVVLLESVEEQALEKRIPLLVKLAPDLSEGELADAVDVILAAHMDGIIVTNTTLGREGLTSKHRVESGGLSGSPLRMRSEAVLCQVAKRVDGTIPIISVGGIILLIVLVMLLTGRL